MGLRQSGRDASELVVGIIGIRRQCENDGAFWPEWLQKELDHLSIYTLGFPASLFEKWAKKEMDMFERAGNVLERFAGKGAIGSRLSTGCAVPSTLPQRRCRQSRCQYDQYAKHTHLIYGPSETRAKPKR